MNSSQPKRYTLEELLEMIDEPNKSACKRLLSENRTLFETVRGSSFNHQTWPGGFLDHTTEVMNFGYGLYFWQTSMRPVPFTLSDVLLVCFLHDIEKPWKYKINDRGEIQYRDNMKDRTISHDFRSQKLAEYGITLTPMQENGMRYVEGEFSDYSNRHRAMSELAALCHMADICSARINHAYPLRENDPWTGAQRIHSIR